jgi:hypothetical protein
MKKLFLTILFLSLLFSGNTNEVQIAIEQFKSEFIYINKKPLKSWYRFLKEELNK